MAKKAKKSDKDTEKSLEAAKFRIQRFWGKVRADLEREPREQGYTVTFQGLFLDTRSVLGVSQKDMAAILGVTDAAVSNWVTGRSMPGALPMKRIAEAFKIPLSFVAELKAGVYGYQAPSTASKHTPTRFKEWFSGVLQEKGISAKQAADQIQVPLNYVNRWLKSSDCPLVGSANYRRLRHWLGEEVDKFYSGLGGINTGSRIRSPEEIMSRGSVPIVTSDASITSSRSYVSKMLTALCDMRVETELAKERSGIGVSQVEEALKALQQALSCL